MGTLPTGKRIGSVILAFVSIAVWGAGCKNATSPTTETTTSVAATVNSVTVGGTASLTSKGQTTQLTATAAYSDGTTQNIASQASWQTDNPAVATVAAGLVTAVGNGQATITATFQGKSGTLLVTVALPNAAVPEWTITLTFRTNTDARGAYYAQSRITWSEKGGGVGYDVTSFLIRYLDEAGTQFTSQSWTAESIRNAWGGSARIEAGGSKTWEINYYFNAPSPLTRLTARFESTGADERANPIALNDQKTSTLAATMRR
jgi:hypothetical protein